MKNLHSILAGLSGERAHQFLAIFAKVLFWSTVAAFIYFFVGLLVPVHAAEGATSVKDLAWYLAATPPGDLSLKLWVGILGDFVAGPLTASGSPTTLLGRMFLTFNGAIFAASSLWLAYGIGSGIIGTTQDGQAMGHRINSAWYPIRVVAGVAGGLPLLGGFTLLQGLLMAIAGMGIGIANYMWQSAVTDPTLVQLVGTNAISGAPAVRPSQVMAAATNMLRSNLCMASYAQQASIYSASMEKFGGNPTPPTWMVISRRLDPQPGGLRIRYGHPGDLEACGAVSVKMDKYRDGDASSFRVASVDYQHIRETIRASATQRLLLADDLIKPLAAGYLEMINRRQAGESLDLAVDEAALEEIARTYADGIKQLVTTNLENSGSSITTAAQQKMLQDGWIGAGAWYSTYAEANAALADAISGLTFTSAPPRSEYADPEVNGDLLQLERSLQAAAARLQGASGASNDDQVLSSLTKDSCAGGFASVTATGNCSLGQSIALKIAGSVFNGSGGGQSWNDDFGLINPVVALKNAGDYVLTIASTLLLAAPIAEIGGKVLSVVGAAATVTGVGTAPGVGAMALGAVASYIAPLGWTLLVVGAVMAIYIPALPWIVWMSAVFSYCASFLEGLIAAPLHSMSHMHTDGEGLGQATTKGYLFVLNALARPAIMVLGFFIASALVVGIGTLIAHGFAGMIAGVQGNSVTGLASIIGLLVVYIVVNITLIQQSFELIAVLPDQIIGYLGAGDAGQSLGRQAEQKINAAFMSATRQGMGGAQASLGAGSKAVKKIKTKPTQGQGEK
jgi:conjugal transfer/type IV secretion protein DotA/TraY